MKNTRLATILRNANALLAVILSGAPFLWAANKAEPGDERRWALDFRTKLEQKDSAQPAEIHLTGDWILTIDAVRATEYDASLQLANARINASGSAVTAGQAEQLLRRLGRLFWATYRNDGTLQSIHFANDTDPSDRNLLQMITAECQFVQAGAQQNSWTALERDGAGQYRAAYTVSGHGRVTKKRLEYVEQGDAQSKARRMPIQLDHSEYVFGVDDGGVAALDGATRVRLEVAPGTAGQVRIVTEIHLGSLRKRRAPEMIGSLTRALPGVVTSSIHSQQPNSEQMRARRDNQLLEGWNTQAILDAAYGTASDPSMHERLSALFRQRPVGVAQAEAMLRKRGPQARITDALGAAKSRSALEALRSIAGDSTLLRPLRVDALSTFVVMQNPNAETMLVPVGLLDDGDAVVASAARIAAGALASAGRAAYPREAEKIDAALRERYRKTQDPEVLANLLGAMGNSVGDSIVPVIRQALQDSRANVRAAAARALRRAPGTAAEEALSVAIMKDDDARVRGAAVFAAGFRNPLGARIGNALLQAAKQDATEQVRVNAINLLSQNGSAVPNVVETLALIAQSDSQPSVRRVAEEALSSIRKK